MWKFHLDKLQIPCFHVPHHNQVHLHLKELHSKHHNLYPTCTWKRQVAKWSTESNQVKMTGNFQNSLAKYSLCNIHHSVDTYIDLLAASMSADPFSHLLFHVEVWVSNNNFMDVSTNFKMISCNTLEHSTYQTKEIFCVNLSEQFHLENRNRL